MITPLSGDPRPAPPDALVLARDAIASFPACFWSRRADAPLATRADVELVVRRLRQHGDRSAWAVAARIQQCL